MGSGAGLVVSDGTNTKSKIAYHRWKINGSFSAGSGSELITSAVTQLTAVGSAMSYSSGIWTFPYTGQWKISYFISGASSGASAYRGGFIQTTSDNSSYSSAISSYTSTTSSTYWSVGPLQTFFDVTDTSLCKVKFFVENAASGSVGSETYFIFEYEADT